MITNTNLCKQLIMLRV